MIIFVTAMWIATILFLGWRCLEARRAYKARCVHVEFWHKLVLQSLSEAQQALLEDDEEEMMRAMDRYYVNKLRYNREVEEFEHML